MSDSVSHRLERAARRQERREAAARRDIRAGAGELASGDRVLIDGRVWTIVAEAPRTPNQDRTRCEECGCQQPADHQPGSPSCLEDRRERDRARGQ
jgi:hypothetical protein